MADRPLSKAVRRESVEDAIAKITGARPDDRTPAGNHKNADTRGGTGK